MILRTTYSKGPFKRMFRVKGYSKKLPIRFKSAGIFHLITNLPSSASALKHFCFTSLCSSKLLCLYNYYNSKNNDDNDHHHIYIVWINRTLFNDIFQMHSQNNLIRNWRIVTEDKLEKNKKKTGRKLWQCKK